MSVTNAWLVCFSCIVLVGCGFNDGLRVLDDSARTVRVVDHFDIERGSTASLNPKSSFYVALPQSVPRPGLGQDIAVLIGKSLAAQFPNVHIARRVEPPEEQLQQAKLVAASYIVTPVVLDWEGNKGIPHPACPNTRMYQSAELRLQIKSAVDGTMVDIVRIRSHSGYLTWWDDTLADIMQRPLSEVSTWLAGRN